MTFYVTKHRTSFSYTDKPQKDEEETVKMVTVRGQH